MRLPRTPGQTIGPFFAFALPWPEGPFVAVPGAPGAIRIGGRLLDGGGQPVSDGLIETWQLAPAGGRGFGRCPTDREGRWAIVTVKPPAARAPDGSVHAPQIAVSVFARGLLKRAVTRLYFPDEQAANDADPLLADLADPAARATLIAVRDGEGLRFDIRLQGEAETAFFDA